MVKGREAGAPAPGGGSGRAVAWSRVPATSANLGPGFDCLGLALQGWELRAWLEPSPADPRHWTHSAGAVHWHLDGWGPPAAPPGAPGENLVVRAVVTAFHRAGQAHPAAWRLVVRSTIPPARGLGSSAAAIVAGLAAANQWLRRAGRPLAAVDLLQLAADLEGHADNVAAALYGGLVVAWRPAPAAAGQAAGRREGASAGAGDGGDPGGGWRAVPVPLGRSLAAVVAIPARTSYTHEARGALPATVAHGDAAFNAARTALLIHALAAGRGDLLAEAMQDRLHQPYRAALFPWLEDLVATAVAAGAFGACLSGAGPSVLALVADEQAPAVAQALAARMAALGLAGRVGLGRAGGPGARSGLVSRHGHRLLRSPAAAAGGGSARGD
ncbi:homoserine kinase [Thermaerobacter sp. PB12/4term]|uniref:homoserine kinase n=1 Tax=Thermaerobacter sp. PB12/4term TaxID=2293838 RepID=UPI001FAB93C8|nr:homoserine kinase [Thermaerobacter sp. PB12/4term]